MDKTLEKIIEAARAGGAQTKKYFWQDLAVVNEKTKPSDLQTTADLEAEKAVFEVLEKHFPDYNLFSEESGKIDKGSDYTFIIDPLDGTNNFVLGIANFSTAIALVKNDTTIFAAVYNSILDHCYCAKKGEGAWLNDKKISVNTNSEIAKATVSFGASYATTLAETLRISNTIGELGVKRFMANWSPALELCLIACGRTEGMVFYSGELHDYMAAQLIAKEAGAKITLFDGSPKQKNSDNEFIITNGTQIHEALVQALAIK